MSAESNVFWGTGKRKSSVARVRLSPGTDIVVNARTLAQYFPRETSQMVIRQPFEVTSTVGQYRVDVNVHGGGNAAQAVAVRHGITRALLEANPELRPALKKAGFITRDSREVERKKYGHHKARKRPQYSKR
jgi:small subunit ribosomal protein S9